MQPKYKNISKISYFFHGGQVLPGQQKRSKRWCKGSVQPLGFLFRVLFWRSFKNAASVIEIGVDTTYYSILSTFGLMRILIF